MSQKKQVGAFGRQRASLPLNSTSKLMKPTESIDEQPEEDEGDIELAREQPINAKFQQRQNTPPPPLQAHHRQQAAAADDSKLSRPEKVRQAEAASRVLSSPAAPSSKSGATDEPESGRLTPPNTVNPSSEYRATLQPVYEPKHYLVNCSPIQLIPWAQNQPLVNKRQWSLWGPARACSSHPISSSATSSLSACSGTCSHPGAIKGSSAHRQVACQHTAGGSLIPSHQQTGATNWPTSTSTPQPPLVPFEGALEAAQQQQLSATPGHRHVIPLHHPDFAGPSTAAEMAAPVPLAHLCCQQVNLRRYSTSVTHSHQTEAALRRVAARGRRLSVLSPVGAISSSGHSQQAIQEIKVAPTQASHLLSTASRSTPASKQSHSSAVSAANRRHTLATVDDCSVLR